MEDDTLFIAKMDGPIFAQPLKERIKFIRNQVGKKESHSATLITPEDANTLLSNVDISALQK